jgi:hypothetical protein
MNELLMRAVVEAAIFAGMSGDDVIPQDSAVAYLEQLASTLKGLVEPDRRAFVRYVARLEAEERASGQTERAAFLASLCEDLGLSEPAK